MQEFEKVTPAEIKARLRAGREVRLYPDDSKVTDVTTTGSAHMGIDSANMTIHFLGSLTGRPCRLGVNRYAKIKVML